MRKRGCLLALLTLLAGCDAPKSAAPQLPVEGTADQIEHAETQRMVRRLDQMREQFDPMQHGFLNVERAELLHQALLIKGTATPIERFRLATELLRAGESVQAAVALEALLNDLPQDDTPRSQRWRRQVQSYLGIALLRQGEQSNCVMLHLAKSCIFPIDRSAIHQQQQGARAAMEVYREMLADDPDDLVTRWLLNLAAQLVGEHPGSIPEEWVISDDIFDSDVSMPRFHNTAHQVGLQAPSLAGGVVVDDFNGDGQLDVMTSSWGPDDPLVLYLNQGNGQFQSPPDRSGLAGLTGGLNLVPADYDNDGDIDVLVLRGAWLNQHGQQPNSLLQNDGQGHFVDVTESSGLLRFEPTQTASWADVNGDGWLDLFIGNESRPDRPARSELWINRGDGSFRNATDESGIQLAGYVKGVVFGDIDNDGRPDLFASLMAGTNRLFLNRSEGGRLAFEDISISAGIGEPINSFAAAFLDYNNDGWQDLFVADFSPVAFQNAQSRSPSESQAYTVVAAYLGQEIGIHPRLYRNLGDGQFEDQSIAAGLTEPTLTMGANFGDLNNDGWLDLYLGTGAPDLRTLIPNRAYLNQGGQAFTEVTSAVGMGHLQKGHGIAFADLDNDGDQDVYASMGGAFSGDVFYNALFENPGGMGRWLQLRLRGTRSNRSAIGSRVAVTVELPNGERRTIHRAVNSGGSFGASSLRLEIGVANAVSIHDVEILWPSGLRQVLSNLTLDQEHVIEEPLRDRPSS